MHWIKPHPFVTRRDCLGVNERIDYRGQIETPLTLDKDFHLENELRHRIKHDGLEAVAVSFLFSYLNPGHELKLGQWLEENFPNLSISLSHRVAPIWREFERGLTTIADAYLKPLLTEFINSVDGGLREKNFGGEENLVLKKDFDGESLKGVSRVLLHFDLTELSQSLVSNEITTSLDGNGVPPRYYLRLYEQKTSELSPTYSLATFPLSSSWEDGTGYTTQDPNSRNGVSWVRSDESFDNTNWSGGTTGSRPIAGGGSWITGSGECSQSFSYESPDVNMDVTDIVNNWLDGTTSNNGLILKWSGSQEDSSDYSGDINFFSADANSIYSPKIEVRWDGHLPCTGSNTASLNELTMSGLADNYLYMKGLRELETPSFKNII